MRTTILVLCGVMFIAGCASEAELTRSELNPDLETTMAPHLGGSDAGDCALRGDCIDPCSVNGADVYRGYFEGTTVPNVTENMWMGGYFEQIDDACHEFTYNQMMGFENSDRGNFLGDVDVIAVKSKPGIPLKISVEASNHSKLEPVVSIYDSLGQLLVVSQDLSHKGSTQIYMRSPIMIPTTGAVESIIPTEYYSDPSFFIAVEHLANYKKGWLKTCDDGDMEGGDRYGFILRVENDENTEANVVFPYFESGSKTYSGRIKRRGEVQYVSIIAPRSATMATVEVIPSSNREMIMSLIDTRYEQAVWVHTASYAAENSRTIKFENNKYVLEDSVTIKNEVVSVYRFTIALSDSIGYSGYGYTLNVTLE